MEQYDLSFQQARNDRAGGAQLVYTMLQTGELVIADTCQNVMRAIESRVHDKKEPLKVEKVVGDPYDDVWDALRYALYSHHDPEKKPLEMRVQDRLAAIREKAGTLNSDSAATLAVVQYQKIMREETEEDEPSHYSGNARLASTDPSMHCRMRLATNPGGPGHALHQHLFLGNRCPHCETGGREAGRIYTDATWLSDKLRLEMSTQYIFGKWDPKGLLPNYDKQLRTQGKAFAKQLLEGCWRAFEGQYFNNWEPNRPGKPMVIARPLIHDDWWWTFWTGTDYGFSGSVAFSVLLCRSPEGGPIYVLDEFPRDLTEARKMDVKRFAREHYKALLRMPTRYEQPQRKSASNTHGIHKMTCTTNSAIAYGQAAIVVSGSSNAPASANSLVDIRIEGFQNGLVVGPYAASNVFKNVVGDSNPISGAFYGCAQSAAASSGRPCLARKCPLRVGADHTQTLFWG